MLKHLIEMAKESQKEEHTLEAAVKKDRSALEKRLKALQKEEEEADLNSTGEAQRIYEDWRREVSVHAWRPPLQSGPTLSDRLCRVRCVC